MNTEKKYDFEPPIPTFPTIVDNERPCDVRDGQFYVFSDDVKMAVKIALTIKRPLLLSGPSGCGKSALASAVARYFQWRYIEETVTSRSQAHDLLWRFDSVQRLRDAQLKEGPDINKLHRYLEPGCLWWAFAPQSAASRGLESIQNDMSPAKPPYPLQDKWHHDETKPAVVLIDEIDKADPDFPASLLVPLGSLIFQVQHIPGMTVSINEVCGPPLLIITTNQERALSDAFLRRCVKIDLTYPQTAADMQKIAFAHYANEYHALCEQVVGCLYRNQSHNHAFAFSQAEVLDVIRACRDIPIDPQSNEFERLLNMIKRNERR
ncbi:MAG: AAA family ATPase [Magnetococcales bacterium]|nr:AAA family ATPase [Magnetococcales bacterium]